MVRLFATFLCCLLFTPFLLADASDSDGNSCDSEHLSRGSCLQNSWSLLPFASTDASAPAYARAFVFDGAPPDLANGVADRSYVNPQGAVQSTSDVSSSQYVLTANDNTYQFQGAPGDQVIGPGEQIPASAPNAVAVALWPGSLWQDSFRSEAPGARLGPLAEHTGMDGRPEIEAIPPDISGVPPSPPLIHVPEASVWNDLLSFALLGALITGLLRLRGARCAS